MWLSAPVRAASTPAASAEGDSRAAAIRPASVALRVSDANSSPVMCVQPTIARAELDRAEDLSLLAATVGVAPAIAGHDAAFKVARPLAQTSYYSRGERDQVQWEFV